MNQNITFSAEQHLIEAARRKAAAESTTLNDEFRSWLATYAADHSKVARFCEVLSTLHGQLVAGKKISRDEANTR